MKFCYSSALLMLCAPVLLHATDDGGLKPPFRRQDSFHRRAQSADARGSFEDTPATRIAMQAAFASAAGVPVTKAEPDPFDGDNASSDGAQAASTPLDERSYLSSLGSSAGSGGIADPFASGVSDEDDNDAFIPPTPAPHSSRSDIRRSRSSDSGDPYPALSDGDESDDDGNAGAYVGKPPRNDRPARPVVHKGGIPLSRLCKWGLGAFVAYKIIDSFFEKNDDPDENDGE